MYDVSIKHESFLIKNKTVIWFWDRDINKAEDFLINNLFVCVTSGLELWNMKSAVGYDDVCVFVSLSNSAFYFVTFSGLGFSISIDTLAVLDKRMTK